MNILQPASKRHSRGRKAHLEYLDTRIVPATVHPALAVAADVASVHAGQQPENIVAGESASQIRHEQRLVKLAERREARLERREMRAERLAARYAARHHITLAGPVQDQVIGAASTSSKSATTTQGTSGPGQSPTGSPPTGSGTGSNVGTSPVGSTAPTSPVSPTNPAGSQGPLPANVSALFDTIYEEYESGTLPASTQQPGQVEIQGSDVGVQIETSNSSEFSMLVADALSLGLQITESSAAYNIVEGFLPISALPAAGQLPGSPSVTPMVYPGVY
jgi:hypothetical protein